MFPTDRSSDPSLRSYGRERSFVRDGVTWRVFESGIGLYDRRRRAHLFFTSAEAMRRVRDYPANWFDLDDDALYAISRRR